MSISEMIYYLKGLGHGSLVHFVLLLLLLLITSPCSLWNFPSTEKLLINDKIIALCQTDMSPERYI